MLRFAVLLFFVTTTLHFPLEHFTGLPLRVLALGMLLVALLSRLPNLLSATVSIAWVYVLMVLVVGVISLMGMPPRSVILGASSYLAFPILILIAFGKDSGTIFEALVPVVKAIGVISVLAAVYQLTVDPLVFGLYAGTNYQWLHSWGTPRSSSLFASPQVFAAWTVFSVIFLDIVDNKNRLFPSAAMTFIAVGGLLSGSFAVVAGLGLYYLIKGTARAPALALSVAAFGIAGFLIASAIQPTFASNPFTRAFAIVGVGGGGTGTSERVQAWSNAINNSPLLGNGIGSASTLVQGAARFNTESYLLGMLYEGGVILFYAFLFLVFRMALSAIGRAKSVEYAAAAVTILFYAFIVHAFYAWSLMIVWVLLIALPFVKPDKERHSPATNRETPQPAL